MVHARNYFAVPRQQKKCVGSCFVGLEMLFQSQTYSMLVAQVNQISSTRRLPPHYGRFAADLCGPRSYVQSGRLCRSADQFVVLQNLSCDAIIFRLLPPTFPSVLHPSASLTINRKDLAALVIQELAFAPRSH